MNDKLVWLRNKLKGLDMQGMIVSNPVNVKYLTGLEAEGILLITRKENVYLTDSRYIEAVNKQLMIDDEIVVCNLKDISEIDYENFFIFCENVGFEESYVTYANYKHYMQLYKINNLVETENIIEQQRMIKDVEEIKNIKKACEITDNAFEYICKYIKKGMTEKQIAKELENYMLDSGANGIAFETIIASGENSSMPHAVPTDRKIQSNDVILIDFGCKYNGYCSDMTRTIFVDGITDSERNIYNLVLENQEKVLEEIKEDANCRILTMMVESDFKVKGHTLDHALGHGVGLDIHELPYVGRKDYNLKENMIITDEPGIYIPGIFGIRIEDTILVNKFSCERLTKSNKEIRIIHND